MYTARGGRPCSVLRQLCPQLCWILLGLGKESRRQVNTEMAFLESLCNTLAPRPSCLRVPDGLYHEVAWQGDRTPLSGKLGR